MDEKLLAKFTKMKAVVEKALTAKNRADGALSAVMQDLEKKYKIKTDEHLSKEIDEKELKLKSLETKIEKDILAVERKYQWDTIGLQN